MGNITKEMLFENTQVSDQEAIEEQYIAGEPFDHTIKHSDAYYEQYMASFKPNTKRRLFYRFVKRSFDCFNVCKLFWRFAFNVVCEIHFQSVRQC